MAEVKQLAQQTYPDRVGAANARDRPAGCMCKKELFFILRPHSGAYYSRPVHDFFTDDLLRRCGITRDEMKRIRVFPPEVNFEVITYLKSLRLI